jgi:hypothetical protein
VTPATPATPVATGVTDIDSLGITRGLCSKCNDCTKFYFATGDVCDFCGCISTLHFNVSSDNKDALGNGRGQCSECKCPHYIKSATGMDCTNCNHKPAKHAIVAKAAPVAAVSVHYLPHFYTTARCSFGSSFRKYLFDSWMWKAYFCRKDWKSARFLQQISCG